MSNKEINAAVKAELKQAGYSAKDCTVSVKDSLYDIAIRVKVKNPAVRLSLVKSILAHWERYELDQRTGEVLQGGNCYLFVEYDYRAFDSIPEEYRAKAAGIVASIAEHDGREVAGNGSHMIHLINMENYGGSREQYNLVEMAREGSGDQTFRTVYGAAGLAEAIYQFDACGTIAA